MSHAPLYITSAGACSAVGMSLDATECALRAGLDHFQESHFYCTTGEPIRVACLHDVDIWGNSRLARWAALAIQECLAGAPGTDLASTPLLLLAAERERPHSDDQRYRDIYERLQQAMGCRFDNRSRIVANGRAGLGPALQLAAQWLAAGEARQVLLVGADSYLDAATIGHYLSAQRLLVPGNSDGFLPGEAAAAVLLNAQPVASCVAIQGLGVAREEGRPDGSVPNRAMGLTQALRQALENAPVAPGTWQLRFSDQNGEGYFAREASNAFTRLGRQGLRSLKTLTLADCVGEVGAATGPLMLAWASRLLLQADAPGQFALAHLANDEGTRTALALAPHPLPGS